jgi:hypothetical protein
MSNKYIELAEAYYRKYPTPEIKGVIDIERLRDKIELREARGEYYKSLVKKAGIIGGILIVGYLYLSTHINLESTKPIQNNQKLEYIIRGLER